MLYVCKCLVYSRLFFYYWVSFFKSTAFFGCYMLHVTFLISEPTKEGVKNRSKNSIYKYIFIYTIL